MFFMCLKIIDEKSGNFGALEIPGEISANSMTLNIHTAQTMTLNIYVIAEKFIKICFSLFLLIFVEKIVNEDQECDQSDLDHRCDGDGKTCAIDESTGKAICICMVGYVRDASGLQCIKKPPTRPPLPETTTEKLDAPSSSYGKTSSYGYKLFKNAQKNVDFCK